MREALISALLSAVVGIVAGQAQGAGMYPLKQRQNQAATTKRFNLTDLPYYEVSYSEDSSPKLLSRFIIALFETDGQLPFYPSLFNVEMALQDFVVAELNAAYFPFSHIKKVHAKVISQANTASTRNMRSLQMRGSELEMELNVTFANEPSPEISDVDLALKMAMENMEHFLTNLTKRAEGDKELENVHSAFRLEISDSTPIEQPTGENTGGEPDGESADNEFLIPLVCAFCAATLFVGFFAIRRQRTSRSRDGRVHQYTSNDDGMRWDDESDIFSFETALLETPNEKAPPTKKLISEGGGKSSDFRYGDENIGHTRGRFASGDENSYRFTDIALESPDRSVAIGISEHNRAYDTGDLFSVANSDDPPLGDSPSQRKDHERFFRLFSSRLNVLSEADNSAITSGDTADSQMVRHAVLAVELGPTEELITPGSYTSSVYTFSDEDEDSEDAIVMTKLWKLSTTLKAGIDQTGRYKARKKPGTVLLKLVREIIFESETLPKKEDLSLSGELLGLSVAGLQSRDEVVSPRSVQSKPFDEESPHTQFYAESRSMIITSMSLEESDRHQRPHMNPFPAYVDRKSLSDSKIKREKEPVALPAKSHSESKLTSRSGLREGSHDWGSEDSASAKINESGFHDWGITLRPVKSPMRSKNEMDMTNGEVGYDQKYLKDTPKDDRDFRSFDALWESEELNSVHKIGRRHTKSTVADGTTNYQSEAMDPQDWSVSTGEDGSVASTEVADTTPQKSGKKRNFLSSADSFHAAEVSNIVEQSPASTATDDEFADIEAATHKQQLISDLAWLENELAPAMDINTTSPGSETGRRKQLGDESRKPLNSSQGDSILEDSLSFRSGDQSRSYYGPGTKKDSASKGLQTILCRDCFAPPGKLKIVIHSTKDGPAIHTVKPGSFLTGHIFPGDLIISVDDVDTRSFTAEQVMKMMTERARYERKISVLHFEKMDEL